MTKLSKRFLSILVVFLFALVMAGCEFGTGSTNPARAAAKQDVADFLATNYGETIGDHAIEPVKANVGIATDEDGIVSDYDIEHNCYSEFKLGAVKATFESSNPEVMDAQWVMTNSRSNVLDENNNIIGIEKSVQKDLVFVVNRQEEDTEVQITITATAPYEIKGVTYNYTDSRTITFTVAAKEAVEAKEMTLAQINAYAENNWADFQLHGINDETGEKLLVVTRGVVTEILWGDGAERHSFLMSDGEESLYVYAPSTSSDSVEIGDLVEVTCVPTYYYSIVETASSPKAIVKVLYGGQEVPEAKPYTVDSWCAAHPDGSLYHSCPGQRLAITGVLDYSTAKGSYVIKSQETGVEMAIYYKAYTAYEENLIKAALGMPVVLTTAIYDYHSSGYWRILPNVYDYPIQTLEMTDADKVAAAKSQLANATIKNKYTVGDEFALPEASVEGVTVTWAQEPEGLLANGVFAKDAEAAKFTATITCGEATDTFEINLKVVKPAGSEITYAPTEEHNEGVAYKFAVVQGNVDNKVLYFNGQVSGNYLATTEDALDAADVFVENAEGGFKLYTMVEGAKKYIEMFVSGTYVNLRLADSTELVYAYNSDYNTFTANLLDKDRYMGTYKTYTTISCSDLSYAATSFVCHLYKAEGAEEVTWDVTTEHNEGVAYKYAVVQGNVDNKVLYFNGAVSGNYLATTEDITEAADVFVENAEGGFKLYTMVEGAKKYIEMFVSGTYVNLRLADSTELVYAYNAVYNTFTANLLDKDRYMGTYKTYTTISCSDLSYAATSFVCHLYKASTSPVGPEPTSDEATLKAAVEACAELASGGVTSEEYTFVGTVTAIIGNTFVIQAGEYAMYVYNKPLEGNAIGKRVEVTATLQNYNGLYETKSISAAEILGDGEAVQVKEYTDLADIEHNAVSTLITLKGLEYVSGTVTVGTSSSINFKLGTTSFTLRTDKYLDDAIEEAIKAKVDALTAGDCVDLEGIIVGWYNGVQGSIFSADSIKEGTPAEPVDPPVGPVDPPVVTFVTVAEAKEATGEVNVKGLVQAIYARGFILYDTTGAILVYNNATVNDLAIGDYVAVKGTVSVYPAGSAAYQLGTPTYEKLTDACTFALPTAVEWTATEIDAAWANITTYGFCGPQVTMTVTLSISGNYYNASIEGSTVALSFSYPTDAVKALVENGKTYDVVAQAISYSLSSGNPRYFNFILLSATEVEETGEPEPVDPPVTPESGLVATFAFGDNGAAEHKDGTAVSAGYSQTNGGYTFKLDTAEKVYGGAFDATGNSCLKLGTGSAASSFSFTVAADVTSVKIYIAGYKANVAKVSINGGEAQSISNQSNNGDYFVITIDTTTNKTITLATLSGGYRAMINTVEFYK